MKKILMACLLAVIAFASANAAEAVDLYVKGTMNSWGNDEAWKMTTSDNEIYTLTGMPVSSSDEFKIANASWSDDYNFGTTEIINEYNKEYELYKTGQGENCKFATSISGKVDFIFNLTTKKLRIVKNSTEDPDGAINDYIYFDNTKGWANPSCYMWEGDNNNGWPGHKFNVSTDLTLGSDSKPYYRVKHENRTSCLFNDYYNPDGARTGNLELVKGDCYNGDGSHSAFTPYDGVGGIFLVGSMNNNTVEAHWRFSPDLKGNLTLTCAVVAGQTFQIYEVSGKTLHVYGSGAIQYDTPVTLTEGLGNDCSLPKGSTSVTFTFDKKNKDLNVVNNDPDGEEPVEGPGRYVYFQNTNNWSKVYCYAWGDGEKNYNSSWPGVELFEKIVINGTTYYKYKLTNPSWKKVIFNNGSGTQSNDLDFYDNGIYQSGGFQNKAIVNGEVVVADNVEYYQIVGNIVDGTDAAYIMESVDGKRIFDGNLRVGSFSIQHIKGKTTTTISPSGYTSIGTTGTFNVVESGNTKFTFNLTGSYTFTLDPDANTLLVEESPLYLRGEMNDWACVDDWKFVKRNGVYVLENKEVHADADFKISSRNWGTTYAGAGMISFGETVKLVPQQNAADCYLQEGSTSVTFTFNPETLELTVENNGELHPHRFIYFDNIGRWENVICYLSDGDNNNGEHGIKLNNVVVGNDGQSYYRAHIDDFTSVSFSDGYGLHRTETLPVVENRIYNADGATDADFLNLPASDSDRYYYYFEKPDFWGDVYAYAWNGDEENLGTWPGKKLTRISGDIFVLGSSEVLTNIFFSNGPATDYKQTVNITAAEQNRIYKVTTQNADNKWEVELSEEEYNPAEELDGLILMSVAEPLTLADNNVSGTLAPGAENFALNFELGNNVGLQIWWTLEAVPEEEDADISQINWNIVNATTPTAEIAVGSGTVTVMAVRGTLHSDRQKVNYDVKVASNPIFMIGDEVITATAEVAAGTELTISCPGAFSITYEIGDNQQTIEADEVKFTVNQECEVTAWATYKNTNTNIDSEQVTVKFTLAEVQLPSEEVLDFDVNNYGLTTGTAAASQALTGTHYSYTVSGAILTADGLSFAPGASFTVVLPHGLNRVVKNIEIGSVTDGVFAADTVAGHVIFEEPCDIEHALTCVINHGRMDGVVTNTSAAAVNVPAIKVTYEDVEAPAYDELHPKTGDDKIIYIKELPNGLYSINIKLPADCHLYYKINGGSAASPETAPRREAEQPEEGQQEGYSKAIPTTWGTDIHTFNAPKDSNVEYYVYHPATKTTSTDHLAFTVDDDTITSGVEGVEVDAAEDAVYYNLQGVRVENPSAGMYIRVINGQAVKVAL